MVFYKREPNRGLTSDFYIDDYLTLLCEECQPRANKGLCQSLSRRGNPVWLPWLGAHPIHTRATTLGCPYGCVPYQDFYTAPGPVECVLPPCALAAIIARPSRTHPYPGATSDSEESDHARK